MIFETHDKVVSEEEQLSIFKYCVQAEYSWGEIDKQGSPETGLIHEIPSDVPIHELLKERALDVAPSVLEGLSLYRMYINLFAPSEKPYFHSDGPEGQITILYYPHLEWDLDDGGETLFFINNTLYGIPPMPNRMVFFDAPILHRATTFRSQHRFSVALKYK